MARRRHLFGHLLIPECRTVIGGTISTRRGLRARLGGAGGAQVDVSDDSLVPLGDTTSGGDGVGVRVGCDLGEAAAPVPLSDDPVPDLRWHGRRVAELLAWNRQLADYRHAAYKADGLKVTPGALRSSSRTSAARCPHLATRARLVRSSGLIARNPFARRPGSAMFRLQSPLSGPFGLRHLTLAARVYGRENRDGVIHVAGQIVRVVDGKSSDRREGWVWWADGQQMSGMIHYAL
jgi:hypothetical protein